MCFCLFQTLESTQCLIVMHNTLQTFISICWIIKKCYLFTCVCNILGSSVFVCIGVIYLFCCTGVYVFSYIFYFPFAILLKLYKLYLALVKTFQFGHHFFFVDEPYSWLLSFVVHGICCNVSNLNSSLSNG